MASKASTATTGGSKARVTVQIRVRIQAQVHGHQGDVACTGLPSKTTTGELEVSIIGGPELHSKLKTGKNLNDDVMNKIVDGVADYLEALDKDSKKK